MKWVFTITNEFSPRNQPKFPVAFRTCLMFRFVYSFLVLAIKMINNNWWKRIQSSPLNSNLKRLKKYRKIQAYSFKFIFSLSFNNILSWNPFQQEVLLRNHLHYRGIYFAIHALWSFEYFIDKILLPHYFLMLLPLVALFALKQIIHTKNKFTFHHVYSWCKKLKSTFKQWITTAIALCKLNQTPKKGGKSLSNSV